MRCSALPSLQTYMRVTQPVWHFYMKVDSVAAFSLSRLASWTRYGYADLKTNLQNGKASAACGLTVMPLPPQPWTASMAQ
jgi:hypothetical protein